MLLIVKAVIWLSGIVTVLGGLVVPICCFENVRDVGLTLTGPIPEPVRLTT